MRVGGRPATEAEPQPERSRWPAAAFGLLLGGHVVHHAEETVVTWGRPEAGLHLALLLITHALVRLVSPLARGDRGAAAIGTTWALGGLLLPGGGPAHAADLLAAGPRAGGALSGAIAELGLGLLSFSATLRVLVPAGARHRDE